MKQTRAYIEELLGKFLEGQTTEGEEQTLTEYFCESHDIPAEWLEYQAMFRSFKTSAYDFSEEETDALLGAVQRPRTGGARIWTLAAAICAAAAMALLVWQPWRQADGDGPAPATGSETARVARVQERAEAPTVAKAAPQVAKAMPRHADAPAAAHEQPRQESRKHEASQKAQAEDTDASDMIETILMLADMTPEETDLAVSPANGSFTVSTSDGGAFTLELTPSGSSIKQTSQQTHF